MDINTIKTFVDNANTPFDLDDSQENMIKKFSRVEYATASVGFLEGFYSPSKYEYFVKGVKRGRKTKENVALRDGYRYYFNKDDKIALVERVIDKIVKYKAYYLYKGDVSLGFWYYVSGDTKLLDKITREVRDVHGIILEYDVVSIIHTIEMNIDRLSFESQLFLYSNEKLTSVSFEQGKYNCVNNDYRSIVHEFSVESTKE